MLSDPRRIATATPEAADASPPCPHVTSPVPAQGLHMKHSNQSVPPIRLKPVDPNPPNISTFTTTITIATNTHLTGLILHIVLLSPT